METNLTDAIGRGEEQGHGGTGRGHGPRRRGRCRRKGEEYEPLFGLASPVAYPDFPLADVPARLTRLTRLTSD